MSSLIIKLHFCLFAFSFISQKNIKRIFSNFYSYDSAQKIDRRYQDAH